MIEILLVLRVGMDDKRNNPGTITLQRGRYRDNCLPMDGYQGLSPVAGVRIKNETAQSIVVSACQHRR